MRAAPKVAGKTAARTTGQTKVRTKVKTAAKTAAKTGSKTASKAAVKTAGKLGGRRASKTGSSKAKGHPTLQVAADRRGGARPKSSKSATKVSQKVAARPTSQGAPEAAQGGSKSGPAVAQTETKMEAEVGVDERSAPGGLDAAPKSSLRGATRVPPSVETSDAHDAADGGDTERPETRTDGHPAAGEVARDGGERPPLPVPIASFTI